MAQRTRDFGLIKAAGCPNSLVGGYFMTELLTITLAGCSIGAVLGFFMDYSVAVYVFSTYELPNLWFVPIVFVVFLALSLIFGLRPILKASKMTPITALSPVTYNNLTVNVAKHRSISKSGITWSIASRSLLRRQSATFRMVILLSIVFILLTVSIAGSVIASGTTSSWIQGSTGKDTVVVATDAMATQYELLLSKFAGSSEPSNFDYSNSNLAIPGAVVSQLKALSSINVVDTRLVLGEQVQEVANFTFDENTGQTSYVGGARTGDSIVVGVDPTQLISSWNVQGKFLDATNQYQAVVGDSISLTMYSVDPSLKISQANPLVEGISFENGTFSVVGVCVDPLNNGFVTYVPISVLENVTGISSPNLLLVSLKDSTDQAAAIEQIKTLTQSLDPNLSVLSLSNVINKDTSFLSSTWQTIMIMPLFALISAALCMVSYMMLAADEQRQELGVLRSVGAKPRFVLLVLAIQSSILLLSSFGIGLSLGTIITVLILMQQPIITGFTVLEILIFLVVAFVGILLFSLYPAFKLSKTSVLKILT